VNPSAIALVALLVGAALGPTRTSRPAHVLTDAARAPNFLVRWWPDEAGELVAAERVSTARRLIRGMDADAARDAGVAGAAWAIQEARAVEWFGAPSPTFFQSSGDLPRPVPGRVLAAFGPRERSGSSTADRHSGLSFDADGDTEVQAVFRGMVVFSGGIPGLGNVVVLDHGDEYHTVYGHLAETAVSVGEIVQAGSPLARGGSLSSSGRLEIYFELRDRGVPLNPSDWIR
jgi:septal ring factor EnvC (AmiA/AmiB activator)